MAYDTLDGQTYILDIIQALDFTNTTENSLLCTNQTRAHGVVIEDAPRFLDINSHHSISFPDDGVVLPPLLHGPVSYLPVRYPTDEELNSTCHDSPWDPMTFSEASVYRRGNNSGEPSELYRSLAATVKISAVSHNSHSSLTPEYLAKNWGITLESAKRTVFPLHNILFIRPQKLKPKDFALALPRADTVNWEDTFRHLLLILFCRRLNHSGGLIMFNRFVIGQIS